VGSGEIVNCLCNAGYTGPNGGACAVGTYKFQRGNATCASCADNAHAAEGSTSELDCLCNAGHLGPDGGPCAACAAGKFKNSRGGQACDLCPAGKYSVTVGAGSDVCVSCVAGKYSETVGAGSDVCMSCVAGRYSTVVGLIINSCNNCPTLSNSLEASDELIDCTCNAESRER